MRDHFFLFYEKKIMLNFFFLYFFQKMNVGLNMRLLSKAVADGLKYLVEHENYPREFLTTAKFIEFVCRWFELINSRKHVNALSKANMLEYNKAIQHLNETIELFKEISIGGCWKPIQTGIITTTMSILSLQKILLDDYGLEFLLTARFSQDCLGIIHKA